VPVVDRVGWLVGIGDGEAAVALGGELREKPQDRSTGPLALAKLADDIGVDREHDDCRRQPPSSQSPRPCKALVRSDPWDLGQRLGKSAPSGPSQHLVECGAVSYKRVIGPRLQAVRNAVQEAAQRALGGKIHRPIEQLGDPQPLAQLDQAHLVDRSIADSVLPSRCHAPHSRILML